MKNRATLNLIGGITLAALVTLSLPKAAVADDMQVSAPPAVTLISAAPVIEAGYYYRGHRYPYRYRGHYFYHRRFRAGRWRYY